MFNPNPSAVAPFLAWAFLAPIPPIGVKPSQAMPSQLNANQLKVIAFNPNPSAVACSWLGPFRLYFFLSVSSQAKPSQAKPSPVNSVPINSKWLRSIWIQYQLDSTAIADGSVDHSDRNLLQFSSNCSLFQLLAAGFKFYFWSGLNLFKYLQRRKGGGEGGGGRGGGGGGGKMFQRCQKRIEKQKKEIKHQK